MNTTIASDNKTKPYILRATKAYYQKNKEEIKLKLNLKRFKNMADLQLDVIQKNELTNGQKWILLTKIVNYKEYKNNPIAREYVDERILNVVKSIDPSKTDINSLFTTFHPS